MRTTKNEKQKRTISTSRGFQIRQRGVTIHRGFRNRSVQRRRSRRSLHVVRLIFLLFFVGDRFAFGNLLRDIGRFLDRSISVHRSAGNSMASERGFLERGFFRRVVDVARVVRG